MDIKVSLERADSEEALNLFEEHRRNMRDLYQGGPIHSFDPRLDAEPPGFFAIARVDGAAVGCGAVGPLEGPLGEVKRVFVRPAFRGLGIATTIMALLEDQALPNGFTTLRLETGTWQPEAIALYESLGYRRIPAFGEYVPDPYSVCYQKVLSLR